MTDTEIPDDIRAKVDACADWHFHHIPDVDDLKGLVARALLAERERCAKIADVFNHDGTIGRAIRSPAKAE